MTYLRDIRQMSVGEVEQLLQKLSAWVDAEEAARNPARPERGGARAHAKRMAEATRALEDLRDVSTKLLLIKMPEGRDPAHGG